MQSSTKVRRGLQCRIVGVHCKYSLDAGSFVIWMRHGMHHHFTGLYWDTHASNHGQSGCFGVCLIRLHAALPLFHSKPSFCISSIGRQQSLSLHDQDRNPCGGRIALVWATVHTHLGDQVRTACEAYTIETLTACNHATFIIALPRPDKLYTQAECWTNYQFVEQKERTVSHLQKYTSCP